MPSISLMSTKNTVTNHKPKTMEQNNLTHWKKLTNPDYIGAYSLQPGEERVVEIINVVRKMVKGPDGKSEECTVANLKNEKPFILNATNCKTLTRIYQTPYIEQWVGRSIVIYVAKIKAFGEEMEALRIKDLKPALPELTPDSEKWKGAVRALAEMTVSIQWIKERYLLSPEHETQLITESTIAS